MGVTGSLDRQGAQSQMNVMTQQIGELSDRMREIFGHVVEAYLERGLPIGSKTLTGAISLVRRDPPESGVFAESSYGSENTADGTQA